MASDNLNSSSSWLRFTDILSQHVILHPFVSLRRVCQVNRACSPYTCVQPFTLLPFMFRQQRKQGISALYRGLSSELLVKGMRLSCETALANYMDWPSEVNQKHFVEDSFKVLTLRAISIALSTPFLCSSVIETVQSVIVVNDRPSFVDCLKDGFFRLIHLRSTPSARMLPIWLLIVPTVCYHVSHSAIWYVVKNSVDMIRKNLFPTKHRTQDINKKRDVNQTRSRNTQLAESTWLQDLTQESNQTSVTLNNIESDSNQISNTIIASLITDITLLPFETVLNRMYIQGTRTIIDNCDETTVVLPVLTNYDGFADCYQSIIRFEGPLGLYKGLGAIILHYSVHFLIFRSISYILREFQSNSFMSKTITDDSIYDQSTLKPSTTKSSLEQTWSNNEFLRLAAHNRQSTPNNPNAYSKFNDSNYGSSTTPKRYNDFPLRPRD